MNRQTISTLFNAKHGKNLESLLSEIDQVAALPFEAASPLPSRAYHDLELAELESERIFRHSWICLGREDSISNPGDYFTHRLDGRPVFVIRRKDKTIGTYSNVCLHRNSTLLEGSGHVGATIICPYHAWAYDPADGRLRGTPFATVSQEQACKSGDVRLANYRTECWGGWIFATLDTEIAPIAEQLVGLEEHIPGYRLERYRSICVHDEIWDANWKALADNFIESYHVFVVHRTSLEMFNPTRGARTVEGADGFTLHFCPIVESADGAWGAAHPAKEGVREEDRLMLADILAFPAFFIVCTHNWIWWMTIQPEGAEQVQVRFGGCVTPEVMDDPAYRDFPREFEDFLMIANGEDKRALRRLMAGTGGRDTPRGRLAPLDRPIWDFIRYLAKKLRSSGD